MYYEEFLKNIVTCFIFQCTEEDPRYGSKYIQINKCVLFHSMKT